MLNNVDDDGEKGERDNVRSNVENVIGGSAGDVLESLGAFSRLDGRGGDDFLFGDSGPDTLIGGAGIDNLNAGSGNDVVDARDGQLDTINCGDAIDIDTLLRDEIERRLPGCESVQVGTLRLAPKAVRAEAGKVARLQLRWRHPQGWRKLRKVELRLTRDGMPVGEVSIDSRGKRIAADGAVALVRKATRLTAKGKQVSARLAIRPDASLAGQTLQVEVEATDVAAAASSSATPERSASRSQPQPDPHTFARGGGRHPAAPSNPSRRQEMTPHITSVVLPDGMRLPYVEQGDPDGMPLVLLHGYSDSWRSWAPVLDHLPQTVHAFAVTQRGHGDADRPADGYRPEDLAGDAAAFMDVVGLEAAVVAGHSAGSVTAQKLAVDRPERTLGLVLVGAAPTFRSNPGVMELWEPVSALTDPVDPGFVRAFQESTVTRPVPAAFLDAVIAESEKLPARVWRAALRDLLEAGAPTAGGPIVAPTLILWGDRDELARRADQDALAAAIPHARAVTYPGCGHAPHWEQPEQVAADLTAFAASAHRGPAWVELPRRSPGRILGTCSAPRGRANAGRGQ